jgi:hypothetical protein
MHQVSFQYLEDLVVMPVTVGGVATHVAERRRPRGDIAGARAARSL